MPFRWPYERAASATSRQNQAALLAGQKIIIANQEKQMATLAEIVADQASSSAELKTLITQGQTTAANLASVSAQPAALQAAGGASPSDLDGIKATIDADKAAMDAALAPAGPQPNPPAGS